VSKTSRSNFHVAAADALRTTALRRIAGKLFLLFKPAAICQLSGKDEK
jgi:hypothetical protein